VIKKSSNKTIITKYTYILINVRVWWHDDLNIVFKKKSSSVTQISLQKEINIMPVPNEVTIPIAPKTYSNGQDNTVTSISIRGYTQFDPNTGVTCMVSMFNTSNQIVANTQVRITDNDWQNWPTNQTEDQDNAYVQSIVLRILGFSAV
jgi:hypothetical protein